MIKRPITGLLILLVIGISRPSAAWVTAASDGKLDRIFTEGKDAFYTTIRTIIEKHFMKSELVEADLARLLNARDEIPYLFERLMIFSYQKDAPLYEDWARRGDEESLRKFKERFLELSQDYAARFVGSLFRKTRLHEFVISLPHNRGKGRLDLVLQSIGFNARNDLPDVPREKWYSNPIKPDLTTQWAVDAVRARECWPRTKGSGVVVAVLDSGIDPYNTLFKDRL
ncbi:MAG: hypothetical protein OEW18_10370, partial [Candidatus Aminicenantes bacterium]|nr:hypothetical protein [Candidatus Aminicenantes bacterium]